MKDENGGAVFKIDGGADTNEMRQRIATPIPDIFQAILLKITPREYSQAFGNLSFKYVGSD